MKKLSKYEKETIINWNEAENLVGAYQRDDPAPLHMKGYVLDQRLAVVAHGQIFCFQICHTHAAFLWIIM